MSELISPPSDWKFRLSLTAADLSAQLSKHRILSVKTFLKGSKRLYSAVSVKDLGLGGSWDGHIEAAALKTKLGQNLRLTALDCFEEKRKTFCAAAWVDNPNNAVKWGWAVDLTASESRQGAEEAKWKTHQHSRVQDHARRQAWLTRPSLLRDLAAGRWYRVGMDPRCN